MFFFFFSTLSGLVEFDGFFLESDPCLVCNNPEVPFSVSITQCHLLRVNEEYERIFSPLKLKSGLNLNIVSFCSTEHKAVIHQSRHSLHHHTAGRQAHRQPHHQQSHREDRWPEAHKNGANHQPLLQQPDCAGNRGAEEQVGFMKMNSAASNISLFVSCQHYFSISLFFSC